MITTLRLVDTATVNHFCVCGKKTSTLLANVSYAIHTVLLTVVPMLYIIYPNIFIV